MRLFRLLPLMLFLLLCGCQGGDSAAGSLPDLDKAQEVRVIPAGETAPTQVLTEKSSAANPNSMAEGSRGRAPGALSDPALPGRPLPDLDRPGSLP